MSTPKSPRQPTPPPPAPPPPTIDTARENVDARDRVRKRKGRAATLVAGEGAYSPGAARLHQTLGGP